MNAEKKIAVERTFCFFIVANTDSGTKVKTTETTDNTHTAIF